MSLIERIEAASATDHAEMDAIDLAIADWCYTGGAPGLVNYDPEMWLIRNGGWARSIDAAVALAERVLPGWRVALNSDHDRAPLWSAQVKRRGETWRPVGHLASTPALALVAAVLRAKEVEG